MMSATYLTVDGEILAETRGGTDRDYVPDALGSVAALLDGAQSVTDAFSYWPYGEERERTGTTATPFTFVGALGYYDDGPGRTYVRARSYRPGLARWQTVDPLWPSEQAYGYAGGNPATWNDPSGLRCTSYDPPKRCTDLIKPGIKWDKGLIDLLKCLRQGGNSKEGITECFKNYGKTLTNEQWDKVKDYLACTLASDTDPATRGGGGGGGNPCDPQNPAYGQSCCYFKYLKCLFNCTGSKGSAIALCMTKCENDIRIKGGKSTPGFKNCLAVAGPGEGGYNGPSPL